MAMGKKRGAFAGRLGFIFATTGAAVGLGNIWKFPFEVADGGGAIFLFVYLVICFAVCYPIMVAEASMGRATQKNAVGAFSALGGKSWAILGKLNVLTAVLILSFYNIVAGWAFGYFLLIIRGYFEIHFQSFINDIFSVGMYSLFFMLATVFVVSRGISKGVERASTFLMPTLLVMMVILIVYVMTLPNAWDGVVFYLSPDFSKVSLGVVYEAVGQAFFSLSLGLGNVLTYGSYLSKKANVIRETSIVTFADVGVAFLAGLMVFPMVAFISGGNMADMQGGPGLLFNTLPQVFGQLGSTVGVLVGGFFFLLIAFAALTSTLSLLEIPVAYAVDEFKVARKNAVPFMGLLVFLVGLPSMLAQGDSAFLSSFITYLGGTTKDFMTFVVDITDTSMILGGFCVAIFTAYVWKRHRLKEELQQGRENLSGSFLEKYIHFSLRYLCPIILGIVLIIGTLSKFFNVTLF